MEFIKAENNMIYLVLEQEQHQVATAEIRLDFVPANCWRLARSQAFQIFSMRAMMSVRRADGEVSAAKMLVRRRLVSHVVGPQCM